MQNIFTSLASPMALFWLVALIMLAAAEAATVGLVCIWFAGGALVALIAAGVGAPLWVQITLFLIVSAVLIALLRPMVRKIILPRKTATNADRHLGKTALVTEEINNLHETGAVKLDGVIWTARAKDDQVIPVGTVIRVLDIQGVKVVVEAAQQPAEV